jgi:hypothetical protein
MNGMRHHRIGDDEPAGQLAGGTGEWSLPSNGDWSEVLPEGRQMALPTNGRTAQPPDGEDDLEPGELWDAGGPGSAAAVARGCRCPMLPNDPRAGLGLLIAPDCPVHRSRLD